MVIFLMAVECVAGDKCTVDVYLQALDGELYDLHSFAKIGERKLQIRSSSWPDQWTWWNNDRWVANWSHLDSFEQRKFLPQKVRGYQISRDRFTGKTWRVMFELNGPIASSSKTLLRFDLRRTEASIGKAGHHDTASNPRRHLGASSRAVEEGRPALLS
jgi:hypothetical protein